MYIILCTVGLHMYINVTCLVLFLTSQRISGSMGNSQYLQTRIYWRLYCNSGIAANTISDVIREQQQILFQIGMMKVVRVARIIKFWCKVIINISVIICHYLPQYQYLKMKLYYIKDKAYKSFIYKITRNILNKCVFKMIF